MSRWSEREIARKLAERDELEPPPGLLEKIKSEIPPMIPVGTGVPEIDRRPPSMPPRQRWLIAASVVLMIGAGGLLTLHRMEVAPVEEPARTAAGLRQPARRQGPTLSAPAVPPPPAQRSLAQPLAQYGGAPAPKPLAKKEEEKLKSLGYVGSGVPGSVEGGVEGGVVGGVPGAAPAAPPVAAPAPPAEDQAEKVTVTAESPLLDERRERDNRINVGGNEAGQQSQYVGPGTANRPQPSSAPRALARAAGANIVWTAPSPLIVTIKTDAGTASYDEVRRSIVAGKLPDPAAIRVGEILNAFDTGDAPLVEGASTPFVHGPQYRLLRINTYGVSPTRLSFSDSAVVRYRLIGSGVSALYEIELRPGESRRDAVVAVLHLGTGGTAVTLSQLTSSWDKASPGFRLSALAAEFAEVLKGSAGDLAEIARQAREVRKDLPGSAKASELAEMVEKAGRIQEGR